MTNGVATPAVLGVATIVNVKAPPSMFDYPLWGWPLSDYVVIVTMLAMGISVFIAVKKYRNK